MQLTEGKSVDDEMEDPKIVGGKMPLLGGALQAGPEWPKLPFILGCGLRITLFFLMKIGVLRSAFDGD